MVSMNEAVLLQMFVYSGNVSIYSQIEVDLIALWPLPPGDMMFEINNEYGFFN